ERDRAERNAERDRAKRNAERDRAKRNAERDRAKRKAEREMTRASFEAHVKDAVATIPARFRRAVDNLAIVIEDEPSAALLAEMDITAPDSLFGLYQGTPLTERTWGHGNTLPDRITLFQGPIEDASDDEDDLIVCIGETLIHELGHYFGLSEEEIEAIEERYWRGDEDDADAEATS
nr:metallopeptidase family protein [Acidobacteriota bacterium]